MSAYAALQEGGIFTDDGPILYSRNSSDEEEEVPEPPVPVKKTRNTFHMNKENVIYDETYVILGLKVDESITLSGQFELIIERGAILINGVSYYHAPQKFKIIQPALSSFPVISSTQVINTDEVRDIKTDKNDHLFTSDYKSVVRLNSLTTGLENIGKYHLPFKNLFKHDEESSFSDYSFDISFQNLEAIQYDKQLVKSIDGIVDIIEPSSFITIGNKNSGKSTVLKLLINKLVEGSPVSVLDLDPGQSEYSKPYCLSITNHYEPIYGYNYHVDEDDLNYFYGFTTPQNNPDSYFTIIEHLYTYYMNNLKPRGFHLVINTPGWVKGYGKELLIRITKLINPDNLILLSSNNNDLLEGLTFKNLVVGKGYFNQSKYSPSEIRNFNKLVYFHKKGDQFLFEHHLLENSPLRISYQTNIDDTSFIGVNAVSVLNYDDNLNDLPVMLDCSIVGYYLVDNEHFQTNKSLLQSDSMVYITPHDLEKFMEYNTNVVFGGICMIHSINTVNKHFNIYFPYNEEVSKIQKSLEQGYKLLIVKGESDIPTSEILMPKLLENFQQKYKKAHKNNQQLPSLPYVSYNNKINGVWKVRRNIMRRGQQ